MAPLQGQTLRGMEHYSGLVPDVLVDLLDYKSIMARNLALSEVKDFGNSEPNLWD